MLKMWSFELPEALSGPQAGCQIAGFNHLLPQQQNSTFSALEFGSAPAWTSRSTTSVWPSLLATYNGLQPSCVIDQSCSAPFNVKDSPVISISYIVTDVDISSLLQQKSHYIAT